MKKNNNDKKAAPVVWNIRGVLVRCGLQISDIKKWNFISSDICKQDSAPLIYYTTEYLASHQQPRAGGWCTHHTPIWLDETGLLCQGAVSTVNQWVRDGESKHQSAGWLCVITRSFCHTLLCPLPPSDCLPTATTCFGYIERFFCWRSILGILQEAIWWHLWNILQIPTFCKLCVFKVTLNFFDWQNDDGNTSVCVHLYTLVAKLWSS